MDILSILGEVIFFLIVFFVIFLVHYYIISFDRKKKKKSAKMTSMDLYILKKFNISEDKINLRTLNFHMSIIDAFIMAFVSTTLDVTDFHMGIKLAISFALLFALIYSLYEIYGRGLKKKIEKNDKILDK